MSGIKLHERQHEVFAHRARFKTVAAGRRFGKSVLSAATILEKAASKRNSLNWYVAPTYKMAKQIMWDDINRRIPSKWVKKRNETYMRIDLANGSVVELKGADKEDSLRGVGLDFVVLDEMQDMRPGVWSTVLRPTLATTGGGALFIGTSKSYNHFYDLWAKGLSGNERVWKSWQFKTADSPFVPKEELEQAKLDMDPRTYRQEFEACHLAETEVMMFDGTKKQVYEVVPGDVLFSLNDSGKIDPCVVQKSGITGVREIIDATLETGEIVSASHNHKFKASK